MRAARTLATWRKWWACVRWTRKGRRIEERMADTPSSTLTLQEGGWWGLAVLSSFFYVHTYLQAYMSGKYEITNPYWRHCHITSRGTVKENKTNAKSDQHSCFYYVASLKDRNDEHDQQSNNILPFYSQLERSYRQLLRWAVIIDFLPQYPCPCREHTVQADGARKTGGGRHRTSYLEYEHDLEHHYYYICTFFDESLRKGSISLIAFKRRLPACLHVNRLCRLIASLAVLSRVPYALKTEYSVINVRSTL